MTRKYDDKYTDMQNIYLILFEVLKEIKSVNKKLSSNKKRAR